MNAKTSLGSGLVMMMALIGGANAGGDLVIPPPEETVAVTNIRMEAHAVIHGTYILAWDLVDTLTGETIPDGELPITYSGVLLGFDESVMDYVPLLDFGSDLSDTLIDAGVFAGLGEAAVVVTASDWDGHLLADSGFVGLIPGTVASYIRDETDCIELLAIYLAARAACEEKDCSALLAAMEQAAEAMEAARLAMEVERARRNEVRSTIPGLQQATVDCNAELDQLAKDLQQAKQDMVDALQAHFDARAIASGNGPAATPISISDGSPGAGNLVVFAVSPGVSASVDISWSTSAGQLASMAALIEADIQSKFAQSAEYDAAAAAIGTILAEIAAKEAELQQAVADLQAAVLSGNHNRPVDTDYRARVADWEAAKAAYDECMAEKAALCAEAERLARELERCEREARLGRDLGDAQRDGNAADEGIREATEDLSGVPQPVKDGDSPAGARAREAQEKVDEAEAEREAAKAHAKEAERLLGEGDLDGAEEEARLAKEAAERARDAAQDAGVTAGLAKRGSDRELRDARERALSLRKRQLRELERWQERRTCCIDYVVTQTLAPIADQFTPDDLADLQEVLADIIDLGGKSREAIEVWNSKVDGGPEVEAIMNELDQLLGSILGPLQEFADKIDGFQQLWEDLSELKGNLATLFENGDSVEVQAQKFGAWLNLIGQALDATVGKVPLLQFITGYFTFLIDGYFLALDLIDDIKRAEFEGLTSPKEKFFPHCKTLIDDLCEGLMFDEMVDKAILGWPAIIQQRIAAEGELFRQWLRQNLLILLSECCEKQLAENPPPVDYSVYIDGILATPAALSDIPVPMETQGLADPLADTSGDGYPNFVGFYFGKDPRLPIAFSTRFEVAQFDIVTDSLALIFERTAGATGVLESLEWSPDMSANSWIELEGVMDVFPQGNGLETIYFFPLDGSSLPVGWQPGFYRLKMAFAEE